ncbi:FAD:protein FMN transferase [Wenzhouxiangella sp. EGI_FJ10409]|uniref:FAD:protein FMN transferase n=1 Tax=Wenzhouxiangella sp. EGI_FJ10409 TaxID=3243767 RepID=UPI0035D82A8F
MRVGLHAAALAALALTACEHQPELVHHRIAAFGSEVNVTLRAGQQADAAVAAVDRELQAMHRRWHAWEAGRLTEINQALAAGRRIELNPEAVAIIERARALEHASGGLFNPAIGRLLALWGFHASELPVGPPPPATAINALLAQSPGMRDLEIRDGTLASRNRAVQLDFGAYIKGVAVERALAILARAGIEHAIVNAGGDLGVIGRRGNRPWRAAVEHPDGEGGRYLADLTVEDGEFVFTSGNYRRYRQGEGIRYGHIIDPRTGYPADGVRSITVIARDGAIADAAATALAVADAGEWRAIAASMGVDAVMRVDANGHIVVTRGMAERVRWHQQPDHLRVVSLENTAPAEALQ